MKTLDNIFREFDILGKTKYGAFKIETVNQTYLCAKGVTEEDEKLPASLRDDKEYKLIMMGLEMIKIAEKYTWGPENKHKFELSVGIHKGPVIAAVVGEHKP